MRRGRDDSRSTAACPPTLRPSESPRSCDALKADDAVSGILLQLPVPAHLDGPSLTKLIPPEKDVDGLTPVNVGLLSLGLTRGCARARRWA